MRFCLLLLLFFQASCATKYLLPGNRFQTPETQGGSLNTQFEIGNTDGNQLVIDTSNGSVTDGVDVKQISRTNYLLSSSLVEQLDWYWSHIGGGNSLLGAKYQFLGGSKLSKSAGHKMAIAVGIGSNEYKTDESTSIDFQLSGQELMLLYGYRLGEFVLFYSNLSYSRYNFTGRITSSDPVLDNLEPKYQTKVLAGFGGVEFDFGAFLAKLELGYQQLASDHSKNASNMVFGYSVGFGW